MMLILTQETDQIGALREALIRYAAWTGSTSKVERSFKQYSWAVEQRRSSSSNALENDELALLCWEKDLDKAVISEVGRKVWQICKFGAPRLPGSVGRIDKGVKRKTDHLVQSET
eukprot:7417251-Pyramimonas_sp.AAC.1